MKQTWQLQEAKSRFSELVNEAVKSGPQIVTKHGLDSVVVVSVKDYRKLTTPKESLIEFFKRAPQIDLDIERTSEHDRVMDL